jgi:hypothetical protein
MRMRGKKEGRRIGAGSDEERERRVICNRSCELSHDENRCR